MPLSKEEFTRNFVIFTAVIVALAVLVGLAACLIAHFCLRDRRRENNEKRNRKAADTSLSYNPLLHSSKSDPLSVDIEFIDSPDPDDDLAPVVVSSAKQVKSLRSP